MGDAGGEIKGWQVGRRKKLGYFPVLLCFRCFFGSSSISFLRPNSGRSFSFWQPTLTSENSLPFLWSSRLRVVVGSWFYSPPGSVSTLFASHVLLSFGWTVHCSVPSIVNTWRMASLFLFRLTCTVLLGVCRWESVSLWRDEWEGKCLQFNHVWIKGINEQSFVFLAPRPCK